MPPTEKMRVVRERVGVAAEDLQAEATAAAEPGEVSFVLADVASREDCRRVAEAAEVPVKQVMAAALAALARG